MTELHRCVATHNIFGFPLLWSNRVDRCENHPTPGFLHGTSQPCDSIKTRCLHHVAKYETDESQPALEPQPQKPRCVATQNIHGFPLGWPTGASCGTSGSLDPHEEPPSYCGPKENCLHHIAKYADEQESAPSRSVKFYAEYCVVVPHAPELCFTHGGYTINCANALRSELRGFRESAAARAAMLPEDPAITSARALIPGNDTPSSPVGYVVRTTLKPVIGAYDKLRDAYVHLGFDRDGDLNAFLRFCVDEAKVIAGDGPFTWRDGFRVILAALGERDNNIILLRHRLFAATKSARSSHTTACSIWGDDGQGHTKENYPQPLPCNCGALENFRRAQARKHLATMTAEWKTSRDSKNARIAELERHRTELQAANTREVETRRECERVRSELNGGVDVLLTRIYRLVQGLAAIRDESSSAAQFGRGDGWNYVRSAARIARDTIAETGPQLDRPVTFGAHGLMRARCGDARCGFRLVHEVGCPNRDDSRHTGLNAHGCCAHDPTKACCDSHPAMSDTVALAHLRLTDWIDSTRAAVIAANESAPTEDPYRDSIARVAADEESFDEAMKAVHDQAVAERDARRPVTKPKAVLCSALRDLNERAVECPLAACWNVGGNLACDDCVPSFLNDEGPTTVTPYPAVDVEVKHGA